MSETASFVDPVFLARFGLSRMNVVDYMLHPLNPFRTPTNTSNEVLAMQGISIGMLMMHGLTGEPLSPQAAEDEYNAALSRLKGEQYELLPPRDPSTLTQPSPLYVLRHVVRTNPTNVKVLGIYYVVEGVIYKSPAVRSLMKANIARTVEGLSGACQALSTCARYHPSVGFLWVFEDDDAAGDNEDGTKDHLEKMNPMKLIQLSRKRKRRRILDNRRPGERTAAEEEGIRATEAIDQILMRLSKSSMLTLQTSATSSANTTAGATNNVVSSSATTETNEAAAAAATTAEAV
jgi:MED6 mediator sub complex component